ncbi:Aldo/keto reductase [Hortaea werneckii]|uniref:NADP-dependent oxidoreductase domain-containing protein n=1 Tax=Hortaea werneckii TaxID=91943 RepID=A0A3M7G3T7_HORWE|nr:Aldo/keto reductase [Hortaea werneckii]KAI7570099.1 Aldo/keto reductase [Hortaea werneckii]KAI7608699.1 Aldo/keto reductase [Hortaea werneckii]KAI7620488.1 Aldo/keto reductase [Hortaea werneckii]KAI7645795.1 Aldo/keto reductase [Hortaea werneckii]
MAIVRAAARSVSGTPVGAVGYGLMGMTMPWAPVEYPVAAKIMNTALDQGANFWNGGIHYGTPTANSLQLLKYYFEQYPEDGKKVVLSIKGAFGMKSGPTGSPGAIRESVEEAAKVLGDTKKVDIFEMARVDPNVPIETSVNALAELVKEGKIGGIGLSEVGASTIRKAHAIHPVSAVEVELSLFTPDPLHNGIVDTCHELNIPIIAYSPISRGWLTGEYRTLDDLPETDYRRHFPRFKPEVFAQNFKLVEAVEQIAKRKGVTTPQVAIGWVCRQGAIPIPGSTKVERVTQNTNPADLTNDEMVEIQKLLDGLPIGGERYGGAGEKLLNA